MSEIILIFIRKTGAVSDTKKTLKRINLSLPEDLLEEIEKNIEENYLTRTKWRWLNRN